MKKQANKPKQLKTVLPASINTIAEAKKLLRDLYNNKEAYHPEDDALDCLQDVVTKEQGELLNKLMVDIYNLEGNNGNHANPIFDPCKFLLQEAEIIKIVDLTGKGNNGKMNVNDLLNCLDDVPEEEKGNQEAIQLREWIERAEDGDEYQTNNTKYIRIN